MTTYHNAISLRLCMNTNLTAQIQQLLECLPKIQPTTNQPRRPSTQLINHKHSFDSGSYPMIKAHESQSQGCYIYSSIPKFAPHLFSPQYNQLYHSNPQRMGHRRINANHYSYTKTISVHAISESSQTYNENDTKATPQQRVNCSINSYQKYSQKCPYASLTTQTLIHISRH